MYCPFSKCHYMSGFAPHVPGIVVVGFVAAETVLLLK
jgi:hypothetical protein